MAVKNILCFDLSLLTPSTLCLEDFDVPTLVREVAATDQPLVTIIPLSPSHAY